jgi:hypothetical protein
MRFIAVFAVVLVISACGSSAPEESPAAADQRAALGVARDWAKAWMAGDGDRGCDLLSPAMRLDVAIAGAGCSIALREMMRKAPELLRKDLAPQPASVRIRDDIAVVELKRSRFDAESPAPLYLVRAEEGWRVGINDPLHRWSDTESCVAGTVVGMQDDDYWNELGDRDVVAFSQLYCEGAGNAPDKLTARENRELTDRVVRELFGGPPGDVS